MSSPERVRHRLQRALERGHPVRLISRHPNADEARGMVVAVGARWVAVALLDEGRRPDGWDLVRLRDVARVRQASNETVTRQILEARGHWPLAAPDGLDLDRATSLLATLTARGDLVSLHCERHRPEALWVGQPLGVQGRDVTIHGLDPEAEWEEHRTLFATRHLTRITLRNAYMDGLALVAGPRPPLNEE